MASLNQLLSLLSRFSTQRPESPPTKAISTLSRSDSLTIDVGGAYDYDIRAMSLHMTVQKAGVVTAADPRRIAIIFGNTTSTTYFVWPDAIPTSPLGLQVNPSTNPTEFHHRDYPGLPQRAWFASAIAVPFDMSWIEIIKLR
jgi:hypothetical protein